MLNAKQSANKNEVFGEKEEILSSWHFSNLVLYEYNAHPNLMENLVQKVHTMLKIYGKYYANLSSH